MELRISTEGVSRAADELAACGKRIRYASSMLDTDIGRLKALEDDMKRAGEVIELEKTEQLLEENLSKIELMTNVLTRVSAEFTLTEDAILDHDMSHAVNNTHAEVNDLKNIAGIVNEVISQR